MSEFTLSERLSEVLSWECDPEEKLEALETVGLQALIRIQELEAERTVAIADNNALTELVGTETRLKTKIAELEAELEKHRWVPVSERLPEDGDRVLVFHSDWGINFGWCKSPQWSTEFLVETIPTHWRYITPPAIETE